jgi:hypothetical protein
MKQNGLLLARYQRGEYVEVWDELRDLGDLVRKPENEHAAREVAREIMRRVRINVETVYERLLKLGYQFQYPDEAFVMPNSRVQSAINEIEETLGYLPLSLEAFYLEVGSVNFMQSWNQIIHYNRPERETASELFILGEEDPLVVFPILQSFNEAKAEESSLKFCFAPDEFHKANYSGGENYHLSLPNLSADFHIQGMYEVNEYFVDYLRRTFRFGGFRGKIHTVDTIEGTKVAPGLQIVERLADQLLPF